MRAIKLFAGVLFLALFLKLAFIYQTSKAIAGQYSAADTIGQGLRLKLLASLPIPASPEPMSIIFGPGPHEMYLLDAALGKIQRFNWETTEREEWTTLDASGCLPSELHVLAAEVMKTQPALLVLNCRHIEVLDNITLAVMRSVEINAEYEIYGFQLSRDEGSLFVVVKRQGKMWTLVYRTDHWKMAAQLNIDFGSISPSGRALVTTFARRRKPSSLAADECGFRLYDPSSGQMISEFVRSAEGNDDVCPETPGRFVPGQSNLLVTTDSLRGAISEWDLTDGTLIKHLEPKMGTPGPPPGIESLDISFDGKLAAVVTSRRESGVEWGITIWDLLNGQKVYETPLGHQVDPIIRAEFFPEDSNLVFVYSNHVEIYEYAFTKRRH